MSINVFPDVWVGMGYREREYFVYCTCFAIKPIVLCEDISVFLFSSFLMSPQKIYIFFYFYNSYFLWNAAVFISYSWKCSVYYKLFLRGHVLFIYKCVLVIFNQKTNINLVCNTHFLQSN